MDDHVAFALRDDLAGTVTIERDGEAVDVPRYGGGVLASGDSDFDVADELGKGDGTIVVSTSNARLIALLDAYRPLKRVAVPADHPAVAEYDAQTRDTLADLAKTRGITIVGRAKKDQLVAALEEQDAALARGDQEAADNVTAGGGEGS